MMKESVFRIDMNEIKYTLMLWRGSSVGIQVHNNDNDVFKHNVVGLTIK